MTSSWFEERQIERENRQERLSQLVNLSNMNPTINLKPDWKLRKEFAKPENNGILRGLTRWICGKCGWGITVATDAANKNKPKSCPECNCRDFHKVAGNKPPAKTKHSTEGKVVSNVTLKSLDWDTAYQSDKNTKVKMAEDKIAITKAFKDLEDEDEK